MDERDDIDRLYEEAYAVRIEIETLWDEAQLTDVLSRGAASAVHRQELSDIERGEAVSVALQNARKWHRLALLSETLGDLIERIDRAKNDLPKE